MKYNSALVEFLNEFFGRGSSATFEDMKNLFSDDFGVDVQTEDGLYLFKYDMISVKWNEMTRECRGSILTNDNEDGSWRYVSRPPDKFFNLREGNCLFSDEKNLKLYMDELYLLEKADGSAIQVYTWKGALKASTLGKITPVLVNDYNFTFDELFWKILGHSKTESQLIGDGRSHFFELCTSYNQIVTTYESDKVFYLTSRDNETGEHCTFETANEISKILNASRPKTFKVSDLNISTLLQLEDFVEFESKKEGYGVTPEGFVLYKGAIPFGKLKNNRYLTYHRIFTGNRGYTLRNLNELFFAGNIDDFYEGLTPIQRSYIDTLRDYLRNVQSTVRIFSESIDREISKKDFAIKIQSDPDLKLFSPFFFQNFDKIVNGETPSLTAWISGRNRNGGFTYESYHDIWKAKFNI